MSFARQNRLQQQQEACKLGSTGPGHRNGSLPGHMTGQQGSNYSQVSAKHPMCHDNGKEVSRKAGHVDVAFQGSVTQYDCGTFVRELLKSVLYERQQLPIPYDEIVSFQMHLLQNTQVEEGTFRKSINSSTWQRFQQTVQDLDDVLEHLEDLFSLSYVPRVLFMLGSSRIRPTELYEINMEALMHGGSERSLSPSACLRRLFHALFTADWFSDLKPPRLMGTTVMALAHRSCGVEWFRPKLDFRIPTRIMRREISLASITCGSVHGRTDPTDMDDYIWFQTPLTIKGFRQ